MKINILFFSAILVFFTATLKAEDIPCPILPEHIRYNPEITTPQEFFGFYPGDWHIRHDMLVAYLRLISEQSDRVRFEEYGKTYQLRSLVLLTITSPENHKNLDSLRVQHIKLADPDASENLDISAMPVVTWLAYSIHGREPSGTNASALVAYYLASADDDKIEDLLEHSIILMDPSLNPDGHDRFATWVNNNQSHIRHSDANHREHWQAWPGSRTNHYWFDLNRDWKLVQHPESRYRVRQFQKWKPNVLGDYHEMGPNNTHYFSPGVPSSIYPLIPDRAEELINKLAQFHAAALDDVEQLYWTEERFGSFNPGMGSTYPQFQGSIGILFEQASSRGHFREGRYGEILFRDAIRNQFLTSLSLLEGSVEHRISLHEHKRDFYLDTRQKASGDEIRAFVLGDPKDPAKVYHLLDILHHHEIKAYRLASDIETDEGRFSSESSWIIPADQPKYLLMKGLFETRTEFRDSLFYDASTWTLPLAFDIHHAELNARQFSETLLGEMMTEPVFPKGNLYGGQSEYAYLFEWHGYYAPRALYRLQQEGVVTMVAKKTFVTTTTEGEKHFDYGTIVVSTGMQEKVDHQQLYEIMQTISDKDAIDVYSVPTGLTQEGIDLGSSSHVIPLEKPTILVVTGRGMNAYEAGEVWHLLDRRYEMPVTMMDWNRLNNADLSRYSTIVLVDGNYNNLSNAHVNALVEWVRDGGVLVAQKRGARWAVNQGLHPATFKDNVSVISSDRDRNTYLNQTLLEGAQRIGGSIFQAAIDRTHPLGYGFQNERLALYRNSEMVFELPEPEHVFAVPIQYTEEPLLSGYVSEKQLDRLKGTPVVYNSRVGSGRVIAMTDNPNFRAYWYGTNKLFANALFFGPVINTSSLQRAQ